MLIDIFGADPTFGQPSRDAIQRCRGEGGLVACEVVWAEVTAGFPSAAPAAEALQRLGVRFSALESDGALLAGDAWRAYRHEGGSRNRLVADFLVGAHAASRAERLLTRDRGFYRRYFKTLAVLDPSGG